MTREERNVCKIREDYKLFLENMNKNPNGPLAINNAICICVGGSRAYNTYSDLEEDGRDSDTDIRGVFIGEKKHYLGLSVIEQVEAKRPKENEEEESEEDKEKEKDTMMEFRKFMKLSLANNPNILEQLFLAPYAYLVMTPEFKLVYDKRQLFLSKKCNFSYKGFAFSQLKRIQSHNEMFKNPIQEPKREDYLITRYKNISTGKVIPKSDYLAKAQRINAIRESGGFSNGESLFEDLDNWQAFEDVDKDAWNKIYKKWRSYNIWRKNRNKERYALEEAYGLDCKHASQIVRLLIQCKQILKDEWLDAYMTGDNLTLIKSVRNGQMSYVDLIKWSESMNKELSDLYETSKLRHTPDHNEIEKLCIRVLSEYLLK